MTNLNITLTNTTLGHALGALLLEASDTTRTTADREASREAAQEIRDAMREAGGVRLVFDLVYDP